MKLKNYQNRIRIQCNRRQLREVIDEAKTEIRRYNEKAMELFLRGGALVRIKYEGVKKIISVVTVSEAYSLLIIVADWFSLGKGDSEYDVHPDPKVATAIITFPDEDLPELEAISTIPFLSKNGDLIFEPGYHKEHKIILDLDPDLKIPSLPEIVTIDDVESAKKLIFDDLFCDFPFVNDSDKAHALAILIQSFIRPHFSGCSPLYLIMAPAPGTGKTYLAYVISIIVTGSPVPAQALPQNEDEWRKRLTSILASGARINFFDNADMNVKIDSASLSLALTSEKVTDRLLGYSKTITALNNGLWLMTGNNPQLTNEMARRTVCIKFDAKCERPHERTNYKHSDLIQWTTENRGRLIHAVIILIKNWIDQGAKPFSGQPLASFVDCTQKIGGILEAAGIKGFLEGQSEFFDAANTESKDLAYFVDVWFERFKEKPVKASQLLSMCYECELLADVIGFGCVRSRETRLGSFITKMNDRVFGQCCIKVLKRGRTHGQHYFLAPLQAASSTEQLNLAPSADYVPEGYHDNHDNLVTTLEAHRKNGAWN